MGDFSKKVRGNKIIGPLRRSFTRDKWIEEFGIFSKPDAEDKAIFKAGCLISEKLENIRKSLKFSNSSNISAATKLRALVAVANHEFLVNKKRTQEAMAELARERKNQDVGDYSLEDFTNIKVKLKGGFDWGADEVIEGLVDGMEIPIRFALQDDPSLKGAPKMNLVQWEHIALELNFGILYRITEDLWGDCLWNGYVPVEADASAFFIPTDIDAIKSYKMGLARRFSLAGAFKMLGVNFNRNLHSQGIFTSIKEARSIERQGKRQVVKVSKSEVPSDLYQELTVMRAYASEPYYTELLEEPQLALEGLSLSIIIRAWTVISQISLILLEPLQKKHGESKNFEASPHARFPEYTPIIQIPALVDGLCAAIGISRMESIRVVEFFTFRGSADQEIWAQPLIPVGNVTLAPYFPAVVSPNLRRLVDVWMKQSGIDLARRGPAFEMHIRSSVAESIKISPLLADVAASLAEDYTFKPSGNREEQIDLLFVIGKTIFVAEAKCILEPVDSKGVAMHRKTVDGAAEQALRKSRSIHENRLDFCLAMKNFGWDIPVDCKIVPLVITSSSSHVGFESRGVPVIDEFILGRYFEGHIEHVAMAGGNLTIVNRIKSVFYSSAAEAEQKAPNYFKSPPQLERFFSGMKHRVVPIYPVNKDDWQGFVSSFECTPSGGLWKTEFVPASPEGDQSISNLQENDDN